LDVVAAPPCKVHVAPFEKLTVPLGLGADAEPAPLSETVAVQFELVPRTTVAGEHVTWVSVTRLVPVTVVEPELDACKASPL
jgi:hypothetical protein